MNEPQEGTEGAIRRIGEVLREHELGWSALEGFHCVSIICDWYGHDLDFPEHRAELIVAALGLTPEHREMADGMAGQSTNWKTGETTFHHKPCTKLRRWVTKWEQQT